MVATPELIRMLPDREQSFPMTYEQWRTLVAEHAHSEWVDGEAIVFMSPKDRHQAWLNLLSFLLTGFVDFFSLGIVRFAPYEMRAIPGGPAREPDLLFVAREHLDRISEQGLAGPADLIVEIISRESERRDRAEKFAEYQAAGVPEYWLFDPRPRREGAEFYHLDAQGRYAPILPDADGRYHSTVLPGFWLDPAWFRQEPLPGALALLAQIAPGVFTMAGRAPAE